MNLFEQLDPQAICLDIKAREKNEAIAELAERLRGHPGMIDFDGFLGAVYAREMIVTTGIGNGVAIPHARTDSVKNFVVGVGVSKEGIEFQAIDETPVKVLILMGIPTAKVKSYLRLLAHLSLMLKQQEFVNRVTNASLTQDVIDAFAAHKA